MQSFLKNGYSTLKNAWDSTLDLIFPESDIVKKVRNLTPEKLERFDRCATLEHRETYAMWNYQDPLVKEIIWQIKFYENENLVELISPFLSDNINSVLLDSESAHEEFILIPIPISPKRKKERGYNQTEYIAKSLVKHLQKIFTIYYQPNILTKPFETKHQTGEKRKTRTESLRGSFSINKDSSIAEKNVILVDDVVTTGATLKEAVDTLYKAGVKKVFCFTIAH